MHPWQALWTGRGELVGDHDSGGGGLFDVGGGGLGDVGGGGLGVGGGGGAAADAHGFVVHSGFRAIHSGFLHT